MPTHYRNGISRFIGRMFTFFVVMLGWITFNLKSMHDVYEYIRGMFRFVIPNMSSISGALLPFSGDYSGGAKFLVAIGLIFLTAVMESREYRGHIEDRTYRLCVYIPIIILFGVMGDNGFIYANY